MKIPFASLVTPKEECYNTALARESEMPMLWLTALIGIPCDCIDHLSLLSQEGPFNFFSMKVWVDGKLKSRLVAIPNQ